MLGTLIELCTTFDVSIQVELKINYGLKGNYEIQTYPKEGTVSVSSSPESIQGVFTPDEEYTVWFEVYENGYLLSRKESPEYEYNSTPVAGGMLTVC